MPKYLVLYKASGAGHEQASEHSPEQEQALMRAWFEWKDSAGDAIVDFGAPSTQVSDGPNSGVGGYSIVQAGNADALRTIFKTNPHHQQGGLLEIHELVDIPSA